MSLLCACHSVNRFSNILLEHFESIYYLQTVLKVRMSDVDSGKKEDFKQETTKQRTGKTKAGKPVLPNQELNINNSALYVDVSVTQWPIIYSPEYNIGFLGLEKLHPFDSGKWGKIFQFLKDAKMVRDDTVATPVEATESDLMVVHPKAYINSLKHSINVAGITEIWPVALLPNFVVQKKVLRPFRYQTGGSVLAGKLAMERGWAINLGGGFHHSSRDRGGGFCAYADITLTIRFLMNKHEVSKVMIVDLDCHQGNGHERDFMHDENVYIMDCYNRNIYPHDGYAKKAIRKKVELQHKTEDQEYLALVHKNLEEALTEFTPDVVVYNAGTDILIGDPLGNLSITAQGIIQRDEIVFDKVRKRNIPIVMLTSGGYLRETSKIIADSILNLKEKQLIGCTEAENAPPPKADPYLTRSQSGGYFTGWFWGHSSSSQDVPAESSSEASEESKKQDL